MLLEHPSLLITDDDAGFRETLRVAFEPRGFRTLVAENGEEALDFIFARGAFSDRKVENGPKVIILDLKLPKVDGMEVLRTLKSDPRTRIIPVVMLTSSKEESDLVESYRLGVNSYIVKPVDFRKFVESVRTLGFYWLLFNQAPKA